ncbi:MAG: extensin-like family protein [Rhizobium sp.]|nr:extensin-like family protein [Rhizobium sp.]
MSIAFFRHSRRTFLPIFLSVALAACSGPMTPPGSIDDETTVSSIDPVDTTDSTPSTYDAPDNAVQETTDSNADYLDTPNLANRESQPLPKIDEEPLPKIDEEPQQTSIPNDGVNIDTALGVEQPASLAEEQSVDIAEGNATQPVVDGIGTDNLTERAPTRVARDQSIDFNDASSADQITMPSKRRKVEEETQVAFMPRTSDPTEEADDFTEMTSADRACRSELQRMGVKFQELPPISNGRSCGIPHPIKVTGFQGGIQLKPAATLNCSMTKIFAKWVKNELVPSSRYRYFSGIKTIHQMSSYSCRKMNSRSNNPWSEHAKGNALDIGGFTLKNGKHIDIRKKGFFAFREKGLLKTVREDSCKYFTTVLGPGDAYHGDHFHFDLRARKRNYRHCSL